MTASPLTAVDNRNLNTALARIAEQRDILERAQRSGLDVSESLAILDALEHQITSVKAEFLPHLP